MKHQTLKSNGRVIVPKLWVADKFFPRFMGLMGKKGLGKEEAVLFPKCNSIHTFFMRFPIDVVFLSAEGQVVEVIEAMKSWRLLLPRRGVRHTLELAAGNSKALGIAPGRTLVWTER